MLIPRKVADHRCSNAEFIRLLAERISLLRNDPHVRPAFSHEMKRFLPEKTVHRTVEDKAFWEYLITVVESECDQAVRSLANATDDVAFEQLM